MKRKPYIIITNDDGLNAKGLKELYNSLKGFCEIFVIAPLKVKSGASQSITISSNIKIVKKKFLDTLAYGVKGTPVDCVKLAIYEIKKQKPILLISGINHGPNFGKFIHYSGTVGAALEAALLKIPSIAFSFNNFDENADFSLAKRIIKIIVKNILNKKISIKSGALLNINIPDVDEIKGIKILPKSNANYPEKYIKIKRKGEIYYSWYVDDNKNNSKKIHDDVALKKGYVVITPIVFDITDKIEIKRLKKKKIEKLIRSELNQTL